MESTSSRVQAFLERAKQVKQGRVASSTAAPTTAPAKPKPQPPSAAVGQSGSPGRASVGNPNVRRTSPSPKPRASIPAPTRSGNVPGSPSLRMSLPSPSKPPTTPMTRQSPTQRTQRTTKVRTPQRQPLSARSSRSQSPGGSTAGGYIIDQNLLREIEALVNFLSVDRKLSLREEQEALTKVKTSIRQHKSRGTPEPRNRSGEASPASDYKAKAKRLLEQVKEETLAMDKKLEALKSENEVLRKQVADQCGEPVAPAVQTKLFQIAMSEEAAEYERELDAQIMDLYHGPGTDDTYKLLAMALGKRLIHEQQQRLYTEEIAAKQISDQEHSTHKLEEKLRVLESRESSPRKALDGDETETLETRSYAQAYL